VHDKVVQIHFAINESASIHPEIANKSASITLTIWRGMFAIRSVMLAIGPIMHAIPQVMVAFRRVQDILRLTQSSTSGELSGQSQIPKCTSLLRPKARLDRNH